jgi:hypothetical protein
MQRRTLLQWAASCAAVLPFQRLRLLAQPRELTPAAVAMLHEISSTVLPASIGAEAVRATVDRFVLWTRGYREGVPLSHGYGHPRLLKTGTSPVPGYVSQLAALAAEAGRKGGRFSPDCGHDTKTRPSAVTSDENTKPETTKTNVSFSWFRFSWFRVKREIEHGCP